jgi:hypothetical protein
MTRVLALALALAITSPALGQSLTCDTQADIRSCFDHRGYLSAEERSRECPRLGQRGPSVDRVAKR